MRSLRLVAWALAGGLLSWCTPPSAKAPIPAGTPFAYRLAVRWDGALFEEGARVVETNLGYRVGVRALYVGLGSLELVACPDEAAVAALTASVARADHAWDADASRLDALSAARLTDEGELLLGAATASGADYCELFWTVGTVDAQASDGFELARAAAHLEGWVDAPDGERRPLDVWLTVGEGVRVPLEDAWTPGAELRLTTAPGRAFDDLAFDALSDVEILFEVIQALGNGSRARFAAPP